MKISTARRIIKESKKGKPHPPELVARCHEVCHIYHDKIAKERALIEEIVATAKKQAEIEFPNDKAKIEVYVKNAREGIEQKVKAIRQAPYKEKPLMCYEPEGARDEKGNVKTATRDPQQHTLAHSKVMQPRDKDTTQALGPNLSSSVPK